MPFAASVSLSDIEGLLWRTVIGNEWGWNEGKHGSISTSSLKVDLMMNLNSRSERKEIPPGYRIGRQKHEKEKPVTCFVFHV